MSAWRKSTHSGTNEHDDCIEVSPLASQGALIVGIRDSKDPRGAKLHLTPNEWTSLLHAIKHGAF